MQFLCQHLQSLAASTIIDVSTYVTITKIRYYVDENCFDDCIDR